MFTDQPTTSAFHRLGRHAVRSRAPCKIVGSGHRTVTDTFGKILMSKQFEQLSLSLPIPENYFVHPPLLDSQAPSSDKISAAD
ncbi:hypothetical protein [Bosea beijingensis]